MGEAIPSTEDSASVLAEKIKAFQQRSEARQEMKAKLLRRLSEAMPVTDENGALKFPCLVEVQPPNKDTPMTADFEAPTTPLPVISVPVCGCSPHAADDHIQPIVQEFKGAEDLNGPSFRAEDSSPAVLNLGDLMAQTPSNGEENVVAGNSDQILPPKKKTELVVEIGSSSINFAQTADMHPEAVEEELKAQEEKSVLVRNNEVHEVPVTNPETNLERTDEGQHNEINLTSSNAKEVNAEERNGTPAAPSLGGLDVQIPSEGDERDGQKAPELASGGGSLHISRAADTPSERAENVAHHHSDNDKAHLSAACEERTMGGMRVRRNSSTVLSERKNSAQSVPDSATIKRQEATAKVKPSRIPKRRSVTIPISPKLSSSRNRRHTIHELAEMSREDGNGRHLFTAMLAASGSAT
jgi:hypothetical protein